nr:hypothetical protein RKHAN_02542 [Rhizobium sp. Khangiran2]
MRTDDGGGYVVGEGSRRSTSYEGYETLDRLPEWYALLGYCHRCRRYGQVERRDVRLVLGGDALLSQIQPLLKCICCHDRRGNTLSIRKLPR